MKAVILCGGKGTRIRDAAESLPKPLIPIGGKPIVWHIMKHYAKFGIKDFVLCLGYKGEQFKDFFLNYHSKIYDFTINIGRPHDIVYHQPFNESDWSVTLVDTGEDTMTAARLRKVKHHLQGEKHFCLTYGDGLSDIDIDMVVSKHEKTGKIATLTAVHTCGRFGEVRVENGLIREFSEKPPKSKERINGGYMVIDNTRIWDHIGEEDGLVLETDLLDPLSAHGELAAYEHDGFWQCMDSPRELDFLNSIWASGNAPWK
ncbi:MAG: glucose-1-phosphate cytidylyltransferase [Pseudomonadota bacterium]